jgi:hypothetical protein
MHFSFAPFLCAISLLRALCVLCARPLRAKRVVKTGLLPERKEIQLEEQTHRIYNDFMLMIRRSKSSLGTLDRFRILVL